MRVEERRIFVSRGIPSQRSMEEQSVRKQEAVGQSAKEEEMPAVATAAVEEHSAADLYKSYAKDVEAHVRAAGDGEHMDDDKGPQTKHMDDDKGPQTKLVESASMEFKVISAATSNMDGDVLRKELVSYKKELVSYKNKNKDLNEMVEVLQEELRGLTLTLTLTLTLIGGPSRGASWTELHT